MINLPVNANARMVNYPDVLGALVGQSRHKLDSVHLSAAVTPENISAGKPFEGLLIAQNMLARDLDLVVQVIAPERDLAGGRGQIFSRMDRPARIGLRPGEVGFVRLPCLTTTQAAPGSGYVLLIEVTVEQPADAKAESKTDPSTEPRVRTPGGGAPFTLTSLTTERRAHLRSLLEVTFSGEIMQRSGGLLGSLGGKDNRVTLRAPFTITPPSISSLPPDQKATYQALWLAEDYTPDTANATTTATSANEPINIARVIASPDAELRKALFVDNFTDSDGKFADTVTDEMVTEIADASPTMPELPVLDRSVAFFPLLKYLQECYVRAGFKLWAGEAVMTAKLFTHILELSTTSTTFRWKTRLDEIMVARSRNQATSQPEKIDIQHLIIVELFPDLVMDATLFGFQTLSRATRESFGTATEMDEYAETLASTLRGFGGSLDMVQAYLPLILGGVLLNNKVVMPKENPVDTLAVFKKALMQRLPMQNDDNSFIFDTAQSLITGLDQ